MTVNDIDDGSDDCVGDVFHQVMMVSDMDHGGGDSAGRGGVSFHPRDPVSYTHLTLPTNHRV